MPDISTPDAVRKIHLDARSIAIPPPNSPVGGHLACMIEQLGIATAAKTANITNSSATIVRRR